MHIHATVKANVYAHRFFRRVNHVVNIFLALGNFFVAYVTESNPALNHFRTPLSLRLVHMFEDEGDLLSRVFAFSLT